MTIVKTLFLGSDRISEFHTPHITVDEILSRVQNGSDVNDMVFEAFKPDPNLIEGVAAFINMSRDLVVSILKEEEFKPILLSAMVGGIDIEATVKRSMTLIMKLTSTINVLKNLSRKSSLKF